MDADAIEAFRHCYKDKCDGCPWDYAQNGNKEGGCLGAGLEVFDALVRENKALTQKYRFQTEQIDFDELCNELEKIYTEVSK